MTILDTYRNLEISVNVSHAIRCTYQCFFFFGFYVICVIAFINMLYVIYIFGSILLKDLLKPTNIFSESIFELWVSKGKSYDSIWYSKAHLFNNKFVKVYADCLNAFVVRRVDVFIQLYNYKIRIWISRY
jgi:hypothetical protein